LSATLLAGIAAGPFTPGFVADTRLAEQLAEIGVILLIETGKLSGPSTILTEIGRQMIRLS
jgi:predicted Kef-type K+ transport protein